jgi:carbonic anhydrase
MSSKRTQAFLSAVLVVLVGGAFAGCAASHPEPTPMLQAAPPVQEAKKVTSAEAIRGLEEGNARFVSGHLQHPRQNPDRRTELSTHQSPFAVILGCADSRTSPEVVFDQGLGDLFVIREAGNVVGDHSLGSIEYAVEHLHTPLVVVMGHKRCGAVAAARETVAANGHAEGHIDSIVAGIRPAVEATVGQDAEATCKAHVRNVVLALRMSEPLIRHLVEEGRVKVVGAYYDLDTGVVRFLDEQ